MTATNERTITIKGKQGQVMSLLSSIIERRDSDFQQFDPSLIVTDILNHKYSRIGGKTTLRVLVSEPVFPESVARLAGERYGLKVAISND